MKFDLFDLLGPKIEFTIEKNTYYKSKVGAIMTIVMIIIFISAFIGFGLDMIFKTKPKVTFNRIKNPENPFFEITDQNFLLTIYDQYSDEQYPEFERMFTIYYDHFVYQTDGTTAHKYNIKLEKCPKATQEKMRPYLRYSPNYYYCFAENSNIHLNGAYTKNIFSFIRLQVDYCKNNNKPEDGPIRNNCIDKEESKRIASKSRIQMNYLIIDTIVDTSNFTYPIINNILSDDMNTEANSWSRMQINIKQININTDTGFIFKTINTQKTTGIDIIKTESFYSLNTDTIFSHLIQCSDWLEIYDRDYIKVQDTLAMMGGFINLSLIILRQLVKYIIKPRVVDIFNQKYCYIKTRENQNFNQVSLENNLIHINPYPLNMTKKKSQIDEKITEITKMNNKGNQAHLYKSNFTFLGSTFRICYFSKISKTNLFKCEKKMINVVSFENFIKLAKNIKLMKFLMLEDHQKELLKICPIPKNNKNTESVQKFFHNINTDNLNKVDKKLYELIYEKI